jgi:hypothetical protein
MTYGCSLPSALERHEKNGARRISKEELNNIDNINSKFNILKTICGNKETPIYWSKKL